MSVCPLAKKKIRWWGFDPTRGVFPQAIRVRGVGGGGGGGIKEVQTPHLLWIRKLFKATLLACLSKRSVMYEDTPTTKLENLQFFEEEEIVGVPLQKRCPRLEFDSFCQV